MLTRALIFSALLVGLLGGGFRPLSAQEPLRVVAANALLQDLTQQIGGDAITVSSLIGAGVDTHGYQPSPADVQRLAQAQVIVINGLGYEGWFAPLLTQSGSTARVIIASAGVAPIALGEDAHHHHHHHHDHGDHGDHGQAADHHAENAAYDPHAFHSLLEGMTYVDAIAHGLGAADPVHAAAYVTRAKLVKQQIALTQAWVEAQLATVPLQRRTIITSHQALAYFARDYGFSVIGVGSTLEDRQASAQDVAAVIRTIQTAGVPVVFSEYAKPSALLAQVAAETGTRVAGPLYLDGPGGADTGAATYLTMFRANVQAIVDGLK